MIVYKLSIFITYKTESVKLSHLIDHLNLSEGQPVQPVHLHHVALSMGLRQLHGHKRGRKMGRRKRAARIRKRFTKIQKNKKIERLRFCCSRTGHSMAADVQTARPIMHKLSASSKSSIACHTLGSQSTHQSVWVSGNVSTHLAMNRKPTTQLVRISTQLFKTIYELAAA